MLRVDWFAPAIICRHGRTVSSASVKPFNCSADHRGIFSCFWPAIRLSFVRTSSRSSDFVLKIGSILEQYGTLLSVKARANHQQVLLVYWDYLYSGLTIFPTVWPRSLRSHFCLRVSITRMTTVCSIEVYPRMCYDFSAISVTSKGTTTVYVAGEA